MEFLTFASNVVTLTYIHHTIGRYIIPSARYFVIHAHVNALIVYRSFHTLWDFFKSPETSIFCIDNCSDPFPNLLTAALHCYPLPYRYFVQIIGKSYYQIDAPFLLGQNKRSNQSLSPLPLT